MRRLIFAALLPLAATLVAFAVASPAIEAGGGGHGCSTPPRDGAGQHVQIMGNCYSPAVLYVQPGESVTWVNQDDYGHNVVTLDGELLGDQEQFFQGGQSGLLKGDLLTYTFDALGAFPYYCSIHPSMLGVVVVGDPASLEFGAGLTLQSSDSQSQANPGQETPPSWAKVTGPAERVGNDSGLRWGEAAIGLGLFGGLLVGLVAVGGGLRLRRPR